jgi:hypothetical protein
MTASMTPNVRYVNELRDAMPAPTISDAMKRFEDRGDHLAPE